MKGFDIHDYNWTWIPPVVGAISGYVIGSVIGYYNGVFSNQTYAQIQQDSIIEGLKGTAVGAAGGAVYDAAFIGKDFIKSCIHRFKKKK